MEIINLDSNGNKIKDLSKVVLSQEKSLLLYQLIIRSNNNRGVTA
ncbi:hypothetical protein ACFC9R_15880 [Enterococcus casseliflavus]|nr:hypothetical protein [Enterococcus sp.]